MTDHAGIGSPLPLRLSQIVPDENQPRKHFGAKEIQELADHILENGQKTPVKVCMEKEKPGVYVLVGGERRFRAFNLIMERTGKEPTVLAYVTIVNNKNELFRESLMDNLLREDLQPLEEADAYAKLRENPHNLTYEEIAKLVSKSFSHIQNRLRLAKLAPNVRKLLDPNLPKDQRLNVTIATEIAATTNDPQEQYDLAIEAVEKQMSLSTARTFLTVSTAGKNNKAHGGGRRRRASDNYLIWKTFLRNTEERLASLGEKFKVGELYDTRPNEPEARARDLASIDMILESLQKLRPLVAESTRDRFKRTGS